MSTTTLSLSLFCIKFSNFQTRNERKFREREKNIIIISSKTLFRHTSVFVFIISPSLSLPSISFLIYVCVCKRRKRRLIYNFVMKVNSEKGGRRDIDFVYFYF